jgi:hypothetical protein
MGPLWVLVGLVGAAAFVVVLFRFVFVPWGTRWGATPAEGEPAMAGDVFLEDDPGDGRRIVMTRAISVGAPVETVWPWVAQLGRGAGFYSYDRLDNGGKTSARHVVSWVPAPALGDASATGYLRHVEPGVELAWWVPGERFLGAETFGARLEDPERPETGARDQFQSYEVVFAAGDRAGVPGKEHAALWHERAIHDLGARFGSSAG